MKLSIEHHNDQFNINFHRAEGEDAFLSIKGCRIAHGQKGPFLSMPASKNEKTGKWWNHAWCDEKFQSAVMQLAGKSKPAPPKPAPKPAAQGSGFEDMADDIPF